MKKAFERGKVRKPVGTDEATRICSFCGQQAAREALRPQVFGQGERLLIVENVPTLSCDHRGETYFTGATLDELECILGNQTEAAVVRPVRVAQFMARAA